MQEKSQSKVNPVAAQSDMIDDIVQSSECREMETETDGAANQAIQSDNEEDEDYMYIVVK